MSNDSGDQGILAIWNDALQGEEAELEVWYQQEHLAERLAVPGFLFGRRFEMPSASPRYFTYYVTANVSALTADAYIKRLENPTPATRRMMSEVFKNMSRTICRRQKVIGRMHGSCVITARFTTEDGITEDLLSTVIDAEEPAIARLEWWQAADSNDQKIAEEERLRGGDQKIASCLVVETLRLEDAENIGADLSRQFPSAQVDCYRLLCEIGIDG